MSYPFASLPAVGAAGGPAPRLPFVRDDGGRAAAGLRGSAGDCCCRALAIASGLPYGEVAELIATFARREGGHARSRSSSEDGVKTTTVHLLADHLGGKWTPLWDACTTISGVLRRGALPPEGRLVLHLNRHVAAVIDGVLHDTFNCGRSGRRRVYGWWTLPHLGPDRQLSFSF